MQINDKSVSGTVSRIIGFGNIFMSDDAIGLKVLEELKKDQAFKDIDLVDGGTSGIDLIFYLKESERVIIVDAVDAGQEKAEIVTVIPSEIDDKSLENFNSYSLHNMGLKDVIGLAKKLGLDDKMIIVGIKPVSIDYGDSISPEVKKKIPEMIKRIKELL